MKKTSIVFVIFLTFLTLQPLLIEAKVSSEVTASKAKKIIMMLDIMAKEYDLGIKNGKIINAIEYKESQVFLEQSLERYQSIISHMPDLKNAKQLKTKLKNLRTNLKDKIDPREIKISASAIQSQILKELGIELRKTPPRAINIQNGRNIFKSNCAQCHGLTGSGDGPLASKLYPAPAVLSDPEITGNDHSTAYDNFQVISIGIANTSMVAWSEFLPEADLWDVTYFIRTFSNDKVELPIVVTANPSQTSDSIQQLVTVVTRALDKSIEVFKTGDIKQSAELAFDAYLNYEGIETGLITKNKDLGLRLESSFGRLRAEIKRGANLNHVEKNKPGYPK